MDPELGDKAAMLDEVITVDKFGSAATVLTGQLARIGQSPLITSIAMSLTEADGKVSTTAGNNTLGGSQAFNRRGFKVGWRRRISCRAGIRRGWCIRCGWGLGGTRRLGRRRGSSARIFCLT
jgi:hypothetical protein